jgi:hypothetical protein
VTSVWLVRHAKPHMRADEPELKMLDSGRPLFFVHNHLELVEVCHE